MKVPFLDLKAQNQALKVEILPLWEEILDSGRCDALQAAALRVKLKHLSA
ncbi:MAG: hypothetical protein LWX51_14035 [Deltaproteobacteria bacterium]|jgi:hypothetical protein|nr:hypothetical protein [Deltaproteobacteria bacterium]